MWIGSRGVIKIKKVTRAFIIDGDEGLGPNLILGCRSGAEALRGHGIELIGWLRRRHRPSSRRHSHVDHAGNAAELQAESPPSPDRWPRPCWSAGCRKNSTAHLLERFLPQILKPAASGPTLGLRAAGRRSNRNGPRITLPADLVAYRFARSHPGSRELSA